MGLGAILSSLGPSVLSGGMDLIGDYFQNQYAENRQNDAQNFSAQQFATRYQMTVKDLIKAGLNPALAYQQGGGNPGGAGIASASPSHLGETMVRGYATAVEAERVKAETENIRADTLQKLELPEKVRSEIAVLKWSIMETDNRIEVLRSEVDKNKSDVKLKIELAQTERRMQRLKALEAQILDPKARAAQTWTGTAAAHGENIRQILGPAKDVVTGAGAAYGASRVLKSLKKFELIRRR